MGFGLSHSMEAGYEPTTATYGEISLRNFGHRSNAIIGTDPKPRKPQATQAGRLRSPEKAERNHGNRRGHCVTESLRHVSSRV